MSDASPHVSVKPAKSGNKSDGLLARCLSVGLAGLLIGGMFGGFWLASVHLAADQTARNNAITALVGQLKAKTEGAIVLDGDDSTFDYSADNGKVNFALRIGRCSGVKAYVDTPRHPDRADQVTLHVLIPVAQVRAPMTDLPLVTDDDLAQLKKALQTSGLKPCLQNDARLLPASG